MMDDRRIISVFIGVIAFCIVFYAVFRSDEVNIANGNPEEKVIYVPLSYGEPIAVAASKGYYAKDSIVTILFERGAITVNLGYDKAYRIVYVDDGARDKTD